MTVAQEIEDPGSVTEYLEADHRRLDAMIPEVESSLQAGSLPAAVEQFAEFTRGLFRHIDAEEKVLFPAFEELTGMTGGGPTFVMRSEHVQLRRLLEAVTSALGAADAAAAGESLRRLVQTLGLHNMKEERMLYPMADRAAGDARHDLAKRLQAF